MPTIQVFMQKILRHVNEAESGGAFTPLQVVEIISDKQMEMTRLTRNLRITLDNITVAADVTTVALGVNYVEVISSNRDSDDRPLAIITSEQAFRFDHKWRTRTRTGLRALVVDSAIEGSVIPYPIIDTADALKNTEVIKISDEITSLDTAFDPDDPVELEIPEMDERILMYGVMAELYSMESDDKNWQKSTFYDAKYGGFDPSGILTGGLAGIKNRVDKKRTGGIRTMNDIDLHLDHSYRLFIGDELIS